MSSTISIIIYCNYQGNLVNNVQHQPKLASIKDTGAAGSRPADLFQMLTCISSSVCVTPFSSHTVNRETWLLMTTNRLSNWQSLGLKDKLIRFWWLMVTRLVTLRCERSISGMPKGSFITCGTNIHSDSRMTWIEFSDQIFWHLNVIPQQHS